LGYLLECHRKFKIGSSHSEYGGRGFAA